MKLLEYQKLSNIKERQNDSLEWKDKAWDFKDEGSSLTFNVDFYDDTSIKFDNYNNFVSIYNQRLDEIKNIINYRLGYWVDNNFEITPSVINDGLHIMKSKVYTFKFKINVPIYEI